MTAKQLAGVKAATVPMLKHSILHEKEMVDYSEKSDPIGKYYDQTLVVTPSGDISRLFSHDCHCLVV